MTQEIRLSAFDEFICKYFFHKNSPHVWCELIFLFLEKKLYGLIMAKVQLLDSLVNQGNIRDDNCFSPDWKYLVKKCQ